MRSIVFVDKPLLQADAFHLLAGRKGVGKGTYVADIAARVTRGEFGPKRRVVWIGSEDSAAIDIKPRVLAAGGDPAMVAIVNEWIQLPRDIARLGATVGSIGDVGLSVIDPLGNHITGKDSNSEGDIRTAIAPLNDLADEHQMVMLGIRHLSEKECKAGATAAILGSSAWVQVPRAVLVIARDNDDAQLSHVQCIAGNRLPADLPGRTFRISGVMLAGLENEVTRAVWEGDSTKNVESLLEQAGPRTSKSAVARSLILDALEATEHGEMESDALDALVGQRTGLAAQTIKNLRVALKNEGMVRAAPKKDETGAILYWRIIRTRAPRKTPVLEKNPPVSGRPDTDSGPFSNGNGLVEPVTFDFPLYTD